MISTYRNRMSSIRTETQSGFMKTPCSELHKKFKTCVSFDHTVIFVVCQCQITDGDRGHHGNSNNKNATNSANYHIWS